MITIIKQQFQDSIFSGRLMISFLVMLIAFLVSMGMMHQEYTARLENYNDSFSVKTEELFWNKIFFWRFDEQGIDSSDTLTYPMGLVKDPSPLLFVARGMDKQMRQSVEFITTFPIIDLTIKPNQEANLYKIAFEAPDFLFILKVLVSLLAILFSYNLVCSEKEQGTLKLLLLNGASRASIFAGKYFGSLLALMVSFTGAYLIFVLSIQMFSPVSFSGEIGIRLLLILLSSLLHVAVFFSIGAMISTFFNESAPSLIVSLFVWLVVVFALPGVSALLAQQFVPVESDERIARTKLETAQQMERDYSAANPDDTSISNTAGYGRRHDSIRDEVNATMKKIDDEHLRKKDAQAELTTTLARISPIGSLTYIMTSLAYTGLEDMRLYRQDLIRMRNKIDEAVTAMLQNPDFAREYRAGEFDIPEDMKEPMYDMLGTGKKQGFVGMAIADALGHVLLDYFLLFMFIAITVSIGFVRFMRYDVR